MFACSQSFWFWPVGVDGNLKWSLLGNFVSLFCHLQGMSALLILPYCLDGCNHLKMRTQEAKQWNAAGSDRASEEKHCAAAAASPGCSHRAACHAQNRSCYCVPCHESGTSYWNLKHCSMSKERTLHFFKDDHSPKINSSTQEDRCSDLDLIQKPYSCKFVELYEATNSRQLHAGLGSLRLVGE